MSLVICKLPKTGLGNQLFPLTRAFLFGYLNNLPVIVTGYNQLKIGPYLRCDKSKRNYRGYFTFEKGILGKALDKYRLLQYRHNEVVKEPCIRELTTKNENQTYIFDRLPHWADYFHELKDYRPLVKKLFLDIVSPAILRKYEQCEPPVIGVHVRMGDFRKLREGEDFSKVGAVRTPMEYFINVINGIRKIHGSDLPVSIFTDGFTDELEPLLSLSNIKVVDGNPDLVDLLFLSKSKMIVTSSGSTFSYWAGFLSDAPLIIHPDHIHQSIRPDEIQHFIYEGAFHSDNSLLINNIKNLNE